MKQYVNQKYGTYAGIVSCIAAAVTAIVYIAMQSMYFSPWIVVLLAAGIILNFVAVKKDFSFGLILAYGCDLIALYRFLLVEIDLRMDVLVDTGIGTLDKIFFVAVAAFAVTIIAGIVASCGKKTPENAG